MQTSVTLLTNCQIIQSLKRQKIVPESFPDDAYLAPDPEKKIKVVSLRERNMIGSPLVEKFIYMKEKTMEDEKKTMTYVEMCEAVRKGKRVTRPTWKENEYVFSNGKVLVHTTPYWTNEPINQELNGYPYVCEQVDVVAEDWVEV